MTVNRGGNQTGMVRKRKMNEEGLFTHRVRKLFNAEKVADAVNRMLIVSVVLSCVGDTETTDDSDLSADRMSRYDSCYDSINFKTGLLFNSHMIINVMSTLKSQFIILTRKVGLLFLLF